LCALPGRPDSAPFDRVMETFCSGVETKELIEYAAQENYGRKR
jgi:hypothetical protein